MLCLKSGSWHTMLIVLLMLCIAGTGLQSAHQVRSIMLYWVAFCCAALHSSVLCCILLHVPYTGCCLRTTTSSSSSSARRKGRRLSSSSLCVTSHARLTRARTLNTRARMRARFLFLASVAFYWGCVCGVLQDAKAQGDGIFLIRCIADLKVQPNAMGKLIVQRCSRRLRAHARAHTRSKHARTHADGLDVATCTGRSCWIRSNSTSAFTSSSHRHAVAVAVGCPSRADLSCVSP
jgi:hypothetical protein